LIFLLLYVSWQKYVYGAITKQVCEKKHIPIQVLLYNSIYCTYSNIKYIFWQVVFKKFFTNFPANFAIGLEIKTIVWYNILIDLNLSEGE